MKKIIFISFIFCLQTLLAWEVNTHRAIDRCALSDVCGGQQRSLNLHQFVQNTEIGQDDYKTEVFEKCPDIP